jgi:GNAT superfamily N-acetyltransferase
MIEITNIEDFSNIYRELITRDFPVNERRPLRHLRALYKRGHYTCAALKENGTLLAYANLLHSADVGGILLDHFAVLPEFRGRGIGGSFLSKLHKMWDKDGIIIESETPEKARTSEARATCLRRLEFYYRCGATNCSVRWKAFGADYNLLWLPINRALEDATPVTDIKRLYGLHLPRVALGMVTRVIKD